MISAATMHLLSATVPAAKVRFSSGKM